MFTRWKMSLATSVMLFLMVCVFGISSVFAAQTKTINIVDSAGRLVKIPQPLNRVVVLNPPVAEVMRALFKRNHEREIRYQEDNNMLILIVVDRMCHYFLRPSILMHLHT